MAATLCLLGCLLLPAQTTSPSPRRLPTAGGDWVLLPRLARDQELLYRGTFGEDGRDGRVRLSRSYRLETRVFVLDTPPQGAEVAVLTLLRHRPAGGEPPADAEAPTSVRLERARVDWQGNVTADVRLAPPLDGPPTLECAAFVPLPGGRVAAGQTWVTEDGDRPPVTWRAVGPELVGGTGCLKLVGEQRSDDWDRPRADRTAWRRQDTVWLVPHLGLAYRLEREILRREPAHREPTQRGVLRLEMESCFALSGSTGDSRRQEVAQALAFRDRLAPLLDEPTRYGPHLAALARQIEHHVETQPETPYRPAVLQVKARVEAARRGERPPEPVREDRPVAAGGALGRLAPDFVATNLSDGGSGRLRRWLGRPVVLVFYHPASPATPAVLRFARQLQADHAGRAVVVGLSVLDDAAAVRRQHAELGLTFPVLAGGGLRAAFGVESTPKLLVLDAAHVIRGEYLGWGQETPQEVRDELKRWLTLPGNPKPEIRNPME